MNSLLMYFFKVLICSGILFLYYWIALRNKKFHQYNRFYLLFSVVCSLLIPLTHLSWFTVEESTANNFPFTQVLYQGDLNPIVITKPTINWGSIVLDVLMAISGILLLLLIVRVLNVIRLTKKYPKVKLEDVDFLDTDIPNAPFSFLNYLFWKHNIDIQSQVGQQILDHELTHIHQKHTWDKLFMQIVSSIMWFNPFYWLMQRELLMIHEFLADEKAIGNQDIQSFAAMLLEARFGKKILDPVHPFAYSPIKRRLKMLTSTNPKYSYMRRLFFLPLLVVVTGLFAFTVEKNDESITSSNIRSIPNAQPLTNKVVSINKTEKAIILNSSLKRKADYKKVENTNPKDTSRFFSFVKSTFPKGNDPLLIVDGQEMNITEFSMPEGDIESITVLKDAAAEKLYGIQGKNGVLIVTSKKRNSNSPKNANRSTQTTTSQPIKYAENIFGYDKKQKKPKYGVDKEAIYPGGNKAWLYYLQRNLRAEVPSNNGAPGTPTGKNYTVIVSFIVGKDGTVSQVKAANDPGYGTAKEAVRVISRSGKWIPAEQKGKPVAYRQRQMITFQVTDDKKVRAKHK